MKDIKWQRSTYIFFFLKVGRGMNCTSSGMMYNPGGIFDGDSNYNTYCSSDSRLCKLGDLSGRQERIAVGKMSMEGLFS